MRHGKPLAVLRPLSEDEWEDLVVSSDPRFIALIERFGYRIRSYRLTPEGRCPNCQVVLPGVNLDSVTNIWTAVAQYEATPGDPSTLTDGPVQTAADTTSRNLYGDRDQQISNVFGIVK